MEQEPKRYELNFTLDSGADLRIHLFDDSDHRWLFDYRYVERPGRRERVTLVNEQKLTVDYKDGVAQKMDLTMNIIHPERLGKEYFVGVDVSRGGKMFVEFYYKKEDGLYRMEKVRVGQRTLEADDDEKGLVKQVKFPFPVKDVVENEFGAYRVPFFKGEDEEANFEFPENYGRE